MALAYSIVKAGAKRYTLTVPFDPNKLWSTSAFARLSGHKSTLVVGYVHSVTSETISAQPLAIADMVVPEAGPIPVWAHHPYSELFIDDVDSFSKVSEVKPPKKP